MPSTPEAMATESAFAQAVDDAQLEAWECPASSPTRDRPAAALPAGGRRRRWPDFANRGGVVGVGSLLAVPMYPGGDTHGVLNFYSPDIDVFGARDVHIAELFAAAVAAFVQDVRGRELLRALGQQLEQALESRAVIDQAKGIIMARHGCTADEAFTCIVTVSRNRNTKVRDLAAELVETARRRD
jgi:GAF domain-containing protein